MNEQNFNPKSSREETHIVEIVGDGRKAFKSTERNVTVWTRFYCFRIGSNCVLFESRDETSVSLYSESFSTS
jgi:hypothetical protein